MALKPVLAPGDCQVWTARTRHAAGRRPDLVALLDAEEHARWSALQAPADRDRFLAAHALVRRVLARHLGVDPAAVPLVARCDRCGGPHGKPRIASGGRGVDVSLSHSGDWVAVALTGDGRVGVDLEQVRTRPVTGALAERVLNSFELGVWRAAPLSERPRLLLTWWTRKEAVAKAVGLGLAMPFRGIDGQASDGDPTLVDLVLEAGYVGSVAVLDAAVRVTQYDGAALLRSERELGRDVAWNRAEAS